GGKAVVHNGFTLSSRQNIVSKTNQTPRRDTELQVLKISFRFHHQQFAFFLGSQFNYLTSSCFRNVYVKYFDRLAFHDVDFIKDNLRLTNLQFITFSPHRLDQDGQMENATAIY